MRYGYHHAQTADAVAWLLSNPSELPPADVATVLTCRVAMLAAATARLERAIRGANVDAELFGTRRRNPDLTRLSSSGPVVLSELLAQIPRHADQAVALSDVLLADRHSRTAQAWIEAARHATLATEMVTTSPAWTRDGGKAWQIVGDVADIVEGLTILDGRLTEQAKDLLPRWAQQHAAQSPHLRLVARHSAALSRSGPLDPSTDGLTRQEASTRPIPVTRFEQIVQGMQVSQRFAHRYPMSIDELRSFALIQSDIAADCVRLVPEGRLQSLRESFVFREVRFRQLAAATTRVASIGYAGGRPILAQSVEIGRVIRQASTSQTTVPLGVLTDFDAEYPLLTRALARNISKAFDSGRYLVPDDNTIALRWRRTEQREKLSLLHTVEEVAGAAGPVHELEWSAQRLAAWDRTANQREADRIAPTPLKRARAPYRADELDDLPSAGNARVKLRAELDRQPLDRPPTPNRRPSRTA